MINLQFIELERLKLLLSELSLKKSAVSSSRRTLTTEEKISTLNMLRSKFPDLFSGLTEENLKDSNFLIKYLSNPLNRNKIKNALINKLPPTQQVELVKSLESAATASVSEQPITVTEAPADAPAAAAAGASAGGTPGMPSAPTAPSMPRLIHNIPQAPKELSTPASTTNTPFSSTAVSSSSATTLRRFNFGTLRSRASNFANRIQNFASGANPFIKTNLNRIGQGLFNMGKIGTGGVFNLGARVGDSGLNAFSRISRPGGLGGGGGIGKLAKSSNKLAIGLIAGMIFFVLIAGVVGGLGNTTPTGEAAPIQPGSNYGLDYTLPLKNSSVQPLDIKTTVEATFPGAKLEYWDTIVQRSQAAGFNPALALALWIEETGASRATLIKNGGSEIITNSSLSKGHLGCAPAEDQVIDESLSCLFNFVAANNFTDGQFADFMAKYSGGPANAPFSNNPYFPKNLKDWYSKLVPTGVGAIVIIAPTTTGPPTTYTPGGGSGILSCPVNNGSVTYGSKEIGGHCSGGYGFDCIKPGQPGYTGRETAVDVKGSDRTVSLPLLSGNSVEWTVDESGTPINDSEGGGIAVAATASSGGKAYRIRFVHLESTALKVGQKASSATPAGQHILPSFEKRSFANHVHITIQEDGVYKPADLYFNLCK